MTWLAVGALLLAGCTTAGDADRPTVTVLAAASLTDAFTALADDLEAARPDLAVRLAFAGSQRLATQVLDGAPADVFASADASQMDRVVAAGATAAAPEVFATNRLAIAVAADNPHGVTSLADLARRDLTVVLAAEQVPAGRYARRALDAAGVSVAPASLEADVRGVLAKVSLGEADAGLVYASDLATAGPTVTAVDLPDVEVRARYLIARLSRPGRTAAADRATQAFVAHVRSDEGRDVLAAHGFGAPR